MTLDQILFEVDHDRVATITRDDLDRLIAQAESARCDSTGIAGRIRTLRLGDRVLVQERDPEGQVFVRLLPSVDAAGRFVQSRLDAYERMWDG